MISGTSSAADPHPAFSAAGRVSGAFRRMLDSDAAIFAAFVLFLCAVWQLVCWTQALPAYVAPSPYDVAERLAELSRDGLLFSGIVATLSRTFYGFAAASISGIAIGFAMGFSRIVRACFRPLLLGVQTLPTVAWAPLAIIFFGLRPSGLYFVIIMSSLPAIALAAYTALEKVPRAYIETARTLGLRKSAIIWRVRFPAALPHLSTGMKLGWTFAWHGSVSAELIKSSVGLGFLMHMGREYGDISQVMGTMLITVLIGLVLDRSVFGRIERFALRRWGEIGE